MFNKVRTYEEFVEAIDRTGFMLLSRNPLGYVSLEDITNGKSWHLGNEYDPWLWKDKFAYEKKGVYTRIFNKRPIFISFEWYPYFLSVYSSNESVEERYENGTLGKMALRLYDILKQHGPLSTHDIKIILSVDSKEEKAMLEKSIVELQRSMDITVYSSSRKVNKQGEPYGWLVSKYATVESWLGKNRLESLPKFTREEGAYKLGSRVKEFVPTATDKDISKFLNIDTVNLSNIWGD